MPRFICGLPQIMSNVSDQLQAGSNRLPRNGIFLQRRQLADSATAYLGKAFRSLASIVTSFTPSVIASATNSQS